MAQPNPIEILNQLHALHRRSLPQYLTSARPWSARSDSASGRVLRLIADDQQVMANRIAAVIIEMNGVVLPSEFPMQFTDLHDLAIDFLLGRVAARQQAEIDFIEARIAQLEPWPGPRAITQEALGAAKAHLDSLNELNQPSLGVAAGS